MLNKSPVCLCDAPCLEAERAPTTIHTIKSHLLLTPAMRLVSAPGGKTAVEKQEAGFIARRQRH
jgi:hypothetical protein